MSSEDWWLNYQKVWNEKAEFKHRFKKLGKVLFCVQSESEMIISLQWDIQGKISKVELTETLDPALPIFSASQENWQRFIN